MNDDRQELDWDKIRRFKWSNAKPPSDWNQSLRPISINGVSLFALDEKGNLYWDGQPVETRKRLSLTWPQAIGAFLVGLSAIAGGIGGAVQGWIAYNDWTCNASMASWFQACPTVSKTKTPD